MIQGRVSAERSSAKIATMKRNWTGFRAFLDATIGLEREDIHIRAYSDHVSDAPMLEFADEAIATTPSPALRKLAKQRGWEIVDWD